MIVVDLGGTSLRAARFDGSALVHRREEDTGPDPAQLLDLVRGLGGGDAVVAVPGRVDHAGGRIGFAPNLTPAWNDALTEGGLSAALGRRVALANDADAAAVGEAFHGAGRPYDDVVYLTLSTGVGAGVVLGRRLARGRSSLAEIGHTILDRDDLSTVEQAASGTALGRLGGAPGEEVVERARSGDDAARAALDEVLHAAAVAAVNLVHLFSPQVVVVGGGLGRNGELVLEPLRRMIAERGPRRLAVEVVPAELGDDAGLWGCAWWRAATA